jgi:hypothetical protein
VWCTMRVFPNRLHSLFLADCIQWSMLSLCFNWALRHEGTLGEWIYSSTHSWLRDWMVMGGHLQAPAAVLPGKDPLVHIGEEAGWAPEPVWTRWWR